MAIEVVDRFELVGTGRGTRQEGKQAERQTGRGTWQTHIYIYICGNAKQQRRMYREREESARRKETNRRTGQGKAERQADRQAHAGRCTNKGRRDRETDQMYSKQERE
jgi:hypothetical protein